MIRAGVVQLCSSDDPAANLEVIMPLVAEAAVQGAQIILTPEVTNCVSASRDHQQDVLREETEDKTLAVLRAAARQHSVWVLIGSLALKEETGDRFVNRSFLIAPSGNIVARYDKIHMFDVKLSEAESYQESSGYKPGDKGVLAKTPLGKIGMTICYDLRFPMLFRQLAQAGAQIICVPSAFSVPTGKAHWHDLLRARAIECGCYVIAPAQSGTHFANRGKQRQTFGHSLVVAPWGEVILDAGQKVGVSMVDLDLSQVDDARTRIPALSHDVTFLEN